MEDKNNIKICKKMTNEIINTFNKYLSNSRKQDALFIGCTALSLSVTKFCETIFNGEKKTSKPLIITSFIKTTCLSLGYNVDIYLSEIKKDSKNKDIN